MASCSPEALAKLVEGLKHADPRVRYAALGHLERETAQSGVLDALLAFLPTATGDAEIDRATRILATTPLSQEQLEQFATWSESVPETDHRYPWSWTHVLGQENLRRWGQKLSTDPRVPTRNRDALEELIEMSNLSPQECWQQILDLDVKLGQMYEDGEIGQDYDDVEERKSELVRVASWHAACRARARQVLDAWVPGQHDALATIAAELLGEQADAACTQTILETMARVDPDEHESVWDRIHVASETLTGATDIGLLLRHVAAARDDDHVSIVKMIARADAPDVAQTIIDLYRNTDRESLRRAYVEGLLYGCELSDEARALVLAEAQRDSDEDDIWDLPEDVAVLSILMGWEGPDVDRVRDRVGSDADRRAHRKGLRARSGRFMSALNERDYDPTAGWDEDFDTTADLPYDDVITPFVRAEPKVGRNDPCPCGSGKKYKKCCGK